MKTQEPQLKSCGSCVFVGWLYLFTGYGAWGLGPAKTAYSVDKSITKRYFTSDFIIRS